MAGTVGDATIGINVNANTSGLEKAQSELNKLVELAKKVEKPFKLKLEASGNGESKLVDQMKKAEEMANKTSEAMKKIGASSVRSSGLKSVNEALEAMQKRLNEANEAQRKLSKGANSSEQSKAWSETTKSVNQYANALKKVQQLQRESERSYQTKQRSSMVDERAQMLSEQRKQKAALADERLKQAQMRTQLIGSGGSSRSKGSIGEDWRWRGKLKSSAAETAGMYSLGMLGANAIMSAGEKVKELFASGYGYATTQSSMKQNWSTLVNGNGASGLSSSKAGNANKIVDTITQQAMENGRGISLVNHGWQQIYHSTDNAQQTNHLMRSALRVGDAMGLTDDEQKHFNQYGISHILDRGYVNGMALNQIEPYDPALKDDLTRAYLAKQKHVSMSDISMDEVEKQRKNLRAWVTAKKVDDTLFKKALNYEGDTKWPDASKKMLSSLSGMRRSLETGVPAAMKNFEDAFSKPLQKSMGGLFYKVSHSFVDGTAEKKATQFGTSLAGVSKAMYSASKAVAPLVKSFGGGFVDGVKSFANSVKSAWHVLSGVGKSIGNMFGSGGGGALKDLLHTFGSLSGKAVGLVALGKLLRHIPIVGNSINSLFSKIPIIGKAFAVNTSAGSKMMSAADTMMSAANKMNSGSVRNVSTGKTSTGEYIGNSVDGFPIASRIRNRPYRIRAKDEKVISERVSTRAGLTPIARVANSSLGRVIDNTFTRGALMASKGGAIKTIVGKTMMGASSLGARAISAVGKTSLGGKMLGGLGSLGSVSKFGKISGFLRKGAPVLNAAFTGFDLYSAFKNNGKGTVARHKAVGNAVGSGIGGVLGTAAGTVLGPLGQIAGGTAGAWAGGKLGSWVGSFFGGSKNKKSHNYFKDLQKDSGLAAKASVSNSKKAQNAYGNYVKAMQTGSTKAAKAAHKGLTQWANDTSSASKKVKKAANSASKGQSKDAKKAAQDAVKAQKKAASETVKTMKKQQSNLKKALSTQTKGQKKELNSMKKAQSQAFKGMNKNAQKQFKSMSKFISKATKSDGKAVKRLGKNMSKGMKSAMKGMTKATKSGMKSVDKSIKSSMKSATKATKSGAKGISNAIKSGLRKASHSAKSAMNGISKAVKSGMSKAKSSARSGAKSIGNAIKSGLRNASRGTKSAMSKVASSVRSGMHKASSAAKSGANKIVSSVKSGMNKVGSATKSAMSKVSDAVKSGMDKANSSMKSAFSKMVSTAQSSTSKVASSFNKIGSGASSASGKVRSLASAINSLHSKTVNIKVNVSGKGASKLATGTAGAMSAFNSIPKYASGIGGHKGGLAVVNDGKGSNWREAFMLPNGRFGLFPKVKNLLIDLPRGTQVLNGNDTARKMPHYANGTPKAKTSGHKGGVKVVIENITVNGNTDKTQAQKVAKLIRNEVQAIFAGQADII